MTVAGYLGTCYRLFELVSHFRFQYLWCAILGGLALVWLRDFRWSLLALFAFGINAWEVLPWYFGKPQDVPGKTSTLKLLLSNVYTGNRESRPLLEFIARENPDIVVLEEINDRWKDELSGLSQGYPTSRVVPREDNFGIGLWTRLRAPILERDVGQDVVPSLLLQFPVEGKVVALLATHPVPPVREEMFQLRNSHFRALATWARSLSGPCIVLGDLNLTLWSPYHTRLLRDSALRNARQGFGVLPTWPTQLPFLKIPLDHCLVSPAIQVRAIRTGPKIGSDHLPLIVELAL